MGLFTKKKLEHKELQKPFDVTGEVRDRVPDLPSATDNQAGASDLASLIKQISASSVQELDDAIADLEMLREKLDGDAAHVRRELSEFAAFGEATFQSMKVFSESLRNNLTGS